jgi:hypothetical protein
MNSDEAIFEAAYEDRVADVERLLHAEPALIGCQADWLGDRTPLHQAAFGGAAKVVELLIARGADVNATTEFGWVPLHYAAAPEEPAVAEILLKHGALVTIANEDGQTPLHFAVDFGKVSVVRLLQSHGADVNATDKNGKTPLDNAESGSDIGKFLKSHGARRGKKSPPETPKPPPEFLAGHEEELGQLMDTVDSQWNTKKGKKTT